MNATKVTKSIKVNPNVLNGNLDQYNPSNFKVISATRTYDSKNLEYHFFEINNTCYNRQRCYLYLFPGQGGDYEWENYEGGYITNLMEYLIIHANLQHPSMTIVMPKIYYDGDTDKVAQAQKITDYIKNVVDDVEGSGSWDSADAYKRRAVAGLCLGGLCAMKCALYWEKLDTSAYQKFFSLGVFSPANEAEYGHWLNGTPNFKFRVPTHHYLYISCGDKDERWNLTKVYVQNFENNNSPVNDFVRIEDGEHNWDSFRTGFADFMQHEIFDSEFYPQNDNHKKDIGCSGQQ